MKKVALLVCLCFVLGMLVAPVSVLMAAGKKHEMKAEIVSVDMAGKMITVKDEKGESKTVPVMGDAVNMLKDLKAGEKVTLECQDNEKGEHQGVVGIKVEKKK
jgi:hypothetical protein